MGGRMDARIFLRRTTKLNEGDGRSWSGLAQRRLGRWQPARAEIPVSDRLRRHQRPSSLSALPLETDSVDARDSGDVPMPKFQSIDDSFRDFIESQKVFFVATAAP